LATGLVAVVTLVAAACGGAAEHPSVVDNWGRFLADCGPQ
jgi:hypothetical protein